MLALSWNDMARKGAVTCLSCSGLLRTTQAIASTSRQGSTRLHQRNHSSSKSSNASGSEPRVPADAAAEAKVPPENPRRSSTRLRRRTRDSVRETSLRGQDGTKYKLPSVPSTQHVHPAEIHIASFFSVHRPISVTTSVPPASSESSFSSIFAGRDRQRYFPADVIYTLSSAVDNMEHSASQSSQEVKAESDLHAAITGASISNSDSAALRHLDANQPQDIQINIQELAKTFRPFVPPPPPVPMDTTQKATSKTQKAAAKRRRTTQKSYTTTLTILESTDPNGRKTYRAQTSPICEDPVKENTTVIDFPPASRQPFLSHMWERQRQLEKWRDNRPSKGTWRAISVKRQRKLKMKKHKYKKLMRRTRNLRRKLDRN